MPSMDEERPPDTSSGPHDELLASMDDQALSKERKKVVRKACQYASQDDDFIVPVKKYTQQYSQLYFMRLQLLRPILDARAKAVWPTLPITRVLALSEGQECVVIGTLFKAMKLRPTILDEYLKESGADTALKTSGPLKYVQDDDVAILEDESGRVKLVGPNIPTSALVTGPVIAVRGREQADGDLLILEVLLPGLATQAPIPMPPAGREDQYVALLSGLDFGDDRSSPLLVELLGDFLTGHLGASPEHGLVGSIAQVIIAGNTLGVSAEAAASGNQGASQGHSGGSKGATAEQKSRLVAASQLRLQQADMWLTQLASSAPVDIMPGPSDPANFALPQQPLHGCLFPQATSYVNFRRVTNPHRCRIDGVSFLGTSGQNVENLFQYSSVVDRMELLESCLQYRHLCPTAPDTLPCYPFMSKEPFIITPCPHVFFAGNQPEYGTKLLKGTEGQIVRVISLPVFSRTGTVVLVNLRTLACHPITFSVYASGS
eukprot:jgi/Mesvir1/12102/Mv00371-RA.1